MSDLMPGQMVVIKAGALIRRCGSEEESYTMGLQNGIVIQQSHLWHEAGREDDFGLKVDYMVLFSADSRMYYVTAGDLMTPDQAMSPDRLFGRLRG